MSDEVRLFEVSMRDGLQNEAVPLSTDVKIALLERLISAGLTDIEVTSFVRPKMIPQLSDAAEVVRRLPAVEGVRYWALVPNRVGLERALDAGVGHIATFMSSSETHNKKNVNRTIRESIAGLRDVIPTAVAEGVKVRAYISTVFGCPYEGDVPVTRTVEIAQTMLDLGASDIALGDTTGMAQPDQIRDVVRALVTAGVPLERLALHLHDTRGTALVNAFAALQEGIRQFDGSVGGIGGCPYAPGAAGNVATEDLAHLFSRLGFATGVDVERLCEAGTFMEEQLGHDLPGRFHQYWAGQQSSARRTA